MKLLVLLGILLAELVFFVSIGAERLSPRLLFAIVEQSGPLVLLAFGMTLVLMTAGIDLSVASSTVLVVCIIGQLFGEAFAWHIVPVAMLLGALLGLVNGILVARMDVPPIIATLGTLFLYRGLCWAVVGERTSISFDWESWESFGEWPLLLAAIVGLYTVGGWFVSRSRWMEEVLMIGGNRVAARYAGIRVGRRLLEVYVLMGALAGASALVFVGRNASVQPSELGGFELQVIVAAVLGGTRVQGGAGSLIGALLGALILTVLDIGFQGLKLSSIRLPFDQHLLRYLLFGALLVFGVWLNTRGRRNPR